MIQLYKLMNDGTANDFRGFKEAPIAFAPTFKYDVPPNGKRKKSKRPVWGSHVHFNLVWTQFSQQGNSAPNSTKSSFKEGSENSRDPSTVNISVTANGRQRWLESPESSIHHSPDGIHDDSIQREPAHRVRPFRRLFDALKPKKTWLPLAPSHSSLIRDLSDDNRTRPAKMFPVSVLRRSEGDLLMSGPKQEGNRSRSLNDLITERTDHVAEDKEEGNLQGCLRFLKQAKSA